MKRNRLAILLILPALLLAAAPADAQKKKKDDKSGQTPSATNQAALSDNQLIDIAISESLAGWQLGDIEMMHKHYADNVIVVSGAWEPALVGWDKYAAAYKVLRARIDGPALDRSNTFITGSGNVAWVTYQWDFRALVDGQPSAWRGQTSLVLEKRNGVWLIVLNHTSLVPDAPRTQTPSPAGKKPGDPPSGPGI